MKLTIPIVAGVLALSAGAFAQQAEIDKALLAAPGNMKAGATVIKWKSDATYDTLKQGTNKLVCYDKSGQPGMPPFIVECTNLANLPRAAQNMKIEAMGDKAKVQEMFMEAEKNGTRVKPEFGSVWIHFMGADEAHARHHTTIAVPGATSQSLGLPDNPKEGGVWIMDAGTSTAHLMTPGS